MHYLDYAAACPVRPEIAEQYADCCRRFCANPHGGTLYAEECRRAILEAERRLLNCLDIPEETARVIWCSGGTEALNLAISGLAGARKIQRAAFDPAAHPAMLEPLKKLSQQSCRLLPFPVSPDGRLQPLAMAAEPVSLLCCCQVNNETGQIQNLSGLRQSCSKQSILCVDAVQSAGRIAIPWEEARLDLLALSARKIGGPASIGALICRRGIHLQPQMLGGGQQDGLRAGTLDTVAIRLFAESAELACRNRCLESKHLQQLQQQLRRGIEGFSGGAWPVFSSPEGVPDIFCFAIPGYEGALIARMLAEQHQILIGTGSACSAESRKTSHVLAAMGIPAKTARCALRISIGYDSRPEDITAFLEALPQVLRQFPAGGRTMQ